MKIIALDRWLKSSPRKQAVTTIVLHGTAGASAESTISWLQRPNVQASYHYIIDRDGTVYKCVPTSRQAWHAGRSHGPNGKHANGYSVGVAFANRENGEKITAKQMTACKQLCKELVAAIPSIGYITTHWAVAPGRKADPRSMQQAELLKFAESVKLAGWL